MTVASRARIAVLASGGGSNLQALLDHHDRSSTDRTCEVVLVASSRRGAGAVDRAVSRGIPNAIIGGSGQPALLELLDEHRIGIVVLAGYLSLVPPEVTRRFHGRMLNVHPALLPAFGGKGLYGERVHRAVLASGARLSGATVHFVDEQYDRGPIAAQWPVPVLDGDTPQSLAARVLRVEHLLLPRVVEAVARGTLRVGDDGRVQGMQPTGAAAAFHLGAHDEGSLARQIDALLQL